MQDSVDLTELVELWTLLEDEPPLSLGKRGSARLGFALPLKVYSHLGRFPKSRVDLPDAVVEYVASQVGVTADLIESYAWDDRNARHHQAQIRRHFGFRECSVADADKLGEWLATHVCQARAPVRPGLRAVVGPMPIGAD